MIFLSDLAILLREQQAKIARFAKKQGLLKRASTVQPWSLINWVTPYGAQRVIAYFRAVQGAALADGKDYLQLREMWARSWRKQAPVLNARRKLRSRT